MCFPFQTTNFEQVLEDVFLCNKLARKIETTQGILNDETTEEDKSGNIIENAQDETMQLYSSKSGKHGWKKTLMIVPSKKFLRSMSLKRKKSSTTADQNNKVNDDDDEESLVWNGIMDKDEPGIAVDGIHAKALSRDSDEDTLITDLNDVDTRNTTNLDDDSIDTTGTMESQKDFGDEGPEKQEGATDDPSCNLFFASSTLCSNLSSTLQEGTVDKDDIPEKGDLVIPRNFETEKPTEKVAINPQRSPKISIVPSSTMHSNGKKGQKTSHDDAGKETKFEFEMILEDSRFGHRKWRKMTPWKKLESSLATRSLAGRSLTSRKSTRSLPLLRKQRLQSTGTAFSDRSRRQKKASSVSKPRLSSWKKMMVASIAEVQHRRSMAQRREIGVSKTRYSGDKSMESADPSIDSDPLEYSESDEDTTARAVNTSDSSAMPAKDQSSTTVMGLHQWSWGVFAKDPKALKEQEDCDDIDNVDSTNNPKTQDGISVPFFGAATGDHDHDGYDSTDDCTTEDGTQQDGDSYSQSQDGSTIGLEEGGDSYFEDSTRDGWIMDEDQLESFEDDDTKKTGDSCSYHTNFSYYSFDEEENDDSIVDREFGEAVMKVKRSRIKLSRDNTTEKSSTPAMTQWKKGVEVSDTKREFFLGKSIRKSFSFNKKKGKKGRINISSDVSVNAESCDSDDIEADGASVIEAVLLKKGVVPPDSEYRDESSSTTSGRSRGTNIRGGNPSSASKKNSNSSSSIVNNRGSTFTKSKKFWKQQRKPEQAASAAMVAVTAIGVGSTKSRRRRWNTRNPLKNDIPSASKNIITVITASAPVANRTKTNKDYLDRFDSVALFDEESHEGDDFDDSSASSSTNSPWERDDDDTQSEDNFHYGHEFYSSHSHNVIRE
jgi:hypothetical protein